MWNYWGFYNRNQGLNRNFYSMEMIGKLVSEYPNRIRTTVSNMPEPVEPDFKGIRMIAGLNNDGNGACLLLSDFGGDSMQLEVNLKNLPNRITKIKTMRFDYNTPEPMQVETELNKDTLVLHKQIPRSCIWMIQFDWK